MVTVAAVVVTGTGVAYINQSASLEGDNTTRELTVLVAVAVTVTVVVNVFVVGVTIHEHAELTWAAGNGASAGGL